MNKRRPFGLVPVCHVYLGGNSFQWDNRTKVQGVKREYNNKDSEYRLYEILW